MHPDVIKYANALDDMIKVVIARATAGRDAEIQQLKETILEIASLSDKNSEVSYNTHYSERISDICAAALKDR